MVAIFHHKVDNNSMNVVEKEGVGDVVSEIAEKSAGSWKRSLGRCFSNCFIDTMEEN